MVLHKVLKVWRCKFVAHSKPLFELCVICMQVWCLEGFGVTLHKLMEV